VFDEPFCNVNSVPDIGFSEVTWGNWHVEAALVYLTDTYVRDGTGNVVAYGAADDGIGYYAGIVWNKIGITYVTEERRLKITESYFSGSRDFSGNTFYQDGNFAVSQFSLPDEVVCARGITLVDITVDVYDEYASQAYTYTDVDGEGVRVTLIGLDPLQVEAVYGYEGNTDGFDLDAIRVYRCAPRLKGDSATGLGMRIWRRGKWCMYNVYNERLERTGPYYIQAGNPRGGINIIGSYWIENLGGGWYAAYYQFDEVVVNGWVYDIIVLEEHLSIRNFPWFTGAPGRDDNADFGVPFYDEDGAFYIFAHFEVEYT